MNKLPLHLNLPSSARLGVVLLNLGGPTSAAACKPFLYNLFTDPDIIKLGGGFWQRQLARLISNRRGPKIAEKYAEINICTAGCNGNAHCENKASGSPCCSPLNPLTEQQRAALEQHLRGSVSAELVRVYAAMRYWEPFTATTLADLKADGITHVVLLPLYPQFSWTTTGSSLREWHTQMPNPTWQQSIVRNYHLAPSFLEAFSERIDEALARFPEANRSSVQLVFSAHGTPLAEVRSGDPYTREIEATVAALMQLRGYDRPHWLSYQSRVGPAKWTQPNTEDLVKRLLAYGVNRLLLVPIAFVTDHIETLMELNTELREDVAGMGLQQLEVTEGLNNHPLFILALAEQVHRAAASWAEAREVPTQSPVAA